jgi:Iron only hydrogenase large subunit, C-terminal domain
VVISISPQSRASLAALHGVSAAAAAKRLAGFFRDRCGAGFVVDTACGRDLALMETAAEFVARCRAARPQRGAPQTQAQDTPRRAGIDLSLSGGGVLRRALTDALHGGRQGAMSEAPRAKPATRIGAAAARRRAAPAGRCRCSRRPAPAGCATQRRRTATLCCPTSAQPGALRCAAASPAGMAVVAGPPHPQDPGLRGPAGGDQHAGTLLCELRGSPHRLPGCLGRQGILTLADGLLVGALQRMPSFCACALAAAVETLPTPKLVETLWKALSF